jgi:hypothetical protein
VAHDVFLSYAVADKATADAVCARLETRGLRCWYAPRDIQPGRQWSGAIVDAIQGARAFVLVYSARSNQSSQVLNEVERAAHRRLFLIPFRIEDAPVSKELEFFVSTPHWLDALTPPLERHIDALADSLQQLLASPLAPPPPRVDGAATRPPARRTSQAKAAVAGLVVLGAGLAVWGATEATRTNPDPVTARPIDSSAVEESAAADVPRRRQDVASLAALLEGGPWSQTTPVVKARRAATEALDEVRGRLDRETKAGWAASLVRARAAVDAARSTNDGALEVERLLSQWQTARARTKPVTLEAVRPALADLDRQSTQAALWLEAGEVSRAVEALRVVMRDAPGLVDRHHAAVSLAVDVRQSVEEEARTPGLSPADRADYEAALRSARVHADAGRFDEAAAVLRAAHQAVQQRRTASATALTAAQEAMEALRKEQALSPTLWDASAREEVDRAARAEEEARGALGSGDAATAVARANAAVDALRSAQRLHREAETRAKEALARWRAASTRPGAVPRSAAKRAAADAERALTDVRFSDAARLFDEATRLATMPAPPAQPFEMRLTPAGEVPSGWRNEGVVVVSFGGAPALALGGGDARSGFVTTPALGIEGDLTVELEVVSDGSSTRFAVSLASDEGAPFSASFRGSKRGKDLSWTGATGRFSNDQAWQVVPASAPVTIVLERKASTWRVSIAGKEVDTVASEPSRIETMTIQFADRHLRVLRLRARPA